MNKFLKIFSTFSLLLVAAGVIFGGCSGQPESGGIVARVNGQPITMRELQARYDLDHLTWTDTQLPQAEDLQGQYGDSLANLIINALVMQELEKKNLAVSDEEMSLAELEAKSDYGEGEFEQTLEEEAIDLDMWRLFLRQRLSVQKFMQTVVRPDIRVSSEESTEYYNNNLAAFSLPARIHFLAVESSDKSALTKILEAYNKDQKTENLVAGPGVRLREVRMREDRISPEWSEDLKKIKQGQASSIRPQEDGWQFLILVGRQPAAVLTLAQAYPLVEKELVEQKLEVAFDLWVNKKINKAEIEISPPLVEAWLHKIKNPEAQGHNATIIPGIPGQDDQLNEEIDPEEEARLFEQESSP